MTLRGRCPKEDPARKILQGRARKEDPARNPSPASTNPSPASTNRSVCACSACGRARVATHRRFSFTEEPRKPPSRFSSFATKRLRGDAPFHDPSFLSQPLPRDQDPRIPPPASRSGLTPIPTQGMRRLDLTIGEKDKGRTQSDECNSKYEAWALAPCRGRKRKLNEL